MNSLYSYITPTILTTLTIHMAKRISPIKILGSYGSESSIEYNELYSYLMERFANARSLDSIKLVISYGYIIDDQVQCFSKRYEYCMIQMSTRDYDPTPHHVTGTRFKACASLEKAVECIINDLGI